MVLVNDFKARRSLSTSRLVYVKVCDGDKVALNLKFIRETCKTTAENAAVALAHYPIWPLEGDCAARCVESFFG